MSTVEQYSVEGLHEKNERSKVNNLMLQSKDFEKQKEKIKLVDGKINN